MVADGWKIRCSYHPLPEKAARDLKLDVVGVLITCMEIGSVALFRTAVSWASKFGRSSLIILLFNKSAPGVDAMTGFSWMKRIRNGEKIT